jgi:hypothetical protein
MHGRMTSNENPREIDLPVWIAITIKEKETNPAIGVVEKVDTMMTIIIIIIIRTMMMIANRHHPTKMKNMIPGKLVPYIARPMAMDMVFKAVPPHHKNVRRIIETWDRIGTCSNENGP